MKFEQGVIGELNWKVYLGDCKDVLQEMINNNEFVDTIMTSPPFFNRRSYAGKPKIDGNIIFDFFIYFYLLYYLSFPLSDYLNMDKEKSTTGRKT